MALLHLDLGPFLLGVWHGIGLGIHQEFFVKMGDGISLSGTVLQRLP